MRKVKSRNHGKASEQGFALFVSSEFIGPSYGGHCVTRDEGWVLHCSCRLRVRGFQCCSLQVGEWNSLERMVLLLVGSNALLVLSSQRKIVLLASALLTSDKSHHPLRHPAYPRRLQAIPHNSHPNTLYPWQHQHPLRPVYSAPPATSTTYLESLTREITDNINSIPIPEGWVWQHQIRQTAVVNCRRGKAVSQ